MIKQQSLSSSLPDEELLELFNRGAGWAFEELVKRYKSKIFGFVYMQVQQQAQDAEDLTQEVFVQLYQKASSFKGESQFSSYLFGIAKNLVYNYFRTKSRRPQVSDAQLDNSEMKMASSFDHIDKAITSQQVENSTPEDIAQNQYNQEIVNHAISLLSNEERQLLYLHDKENFTYDQISEILRLKVGTIRSRLHNTRKKLMVILKRGR